MLAARRIYCYSNLELHAKTNLAGRGPRYTAPSLISCCKTQSVGTSDTQVLTASHTGHDDAIALILAGESARASKRFVISAVRQFRTWSSDLRLRN